MAEDVADRAGGDVCIFLGGGDDDGFDFGGEAAVGVGDCAFVFEVEHVADAADDVMDAEVAADVYGKAVVFNDFDVLQTGGGLADYVFLDVSGVEAALVLVDADCDYDFVEHGEGAPQYVEVPCSERVE